MFKFLFNIINIFILLLGILLSKFVIFINKTHLLKGIWLKLSGIFSTDSSIITYKSYFKRILKNFYLIFVILIITIFFYTLIFLFFSGFDIDIISCNKGLLFVFIYFVVYFLFVYDSFLENYLNFDLEVDEVDDFDFFEGWSDLEDELSSELDDDAFLSTAYKEFSEVSPENPDTYEVFLTSVEYFPDDFGEFDTRWLYINKYKIPLEEEEAGVDSFYDDILLFERWHQISNEIFQAYFRNRLLIKNNYKNIKKKKLKKNIIDFRFNIYNNFYNDLLYKNVNYIKNYSDLQKFMLNKFLLNYYLSDNFILYFSYCSPTFALLKNKKKTTKWRHSRVNTYTFWGLNDFNNLYFSKKIKLLINSTELLKNSLFSNYNNYIFDSHFTYNYGIYGLSVTKTLSNFIGIDYSFLVSSYFYGNRSYTFSKNNLLILDQLLENLSIENFYSINYLNRFFDINEYFILNLLQKKIELSEQNEIDLFNSIIFNSKFWLKLTHLYNSDFFKFILNTIFTVFIYKFKTFEISKKTNLNYLFNFFETMFSEDLKILFNSVFFKKYVKINFEVLFLKLTNKIIKKLYSEESLFEKSQSFQFKLLFRFFYYKTLIPEQFVFIPSTTSLIKLENAYTNEYLSTFAFLFSSKSSRHLFVTVRKRLLVLFHEQPKFFDIGYPKQDRYKYYRAFQEATIEGLHSWFPSFRNLISLLPIIYISTWAIFEDNSKVGLQDTDEIIKFLRFSTPYTRYFLKYEKKNYLSSVFNTDLRAFTTDNDKVAYNTFLSSENNYSNNFFFQLFYGLPFLFKTKLKFNRIIALKVNLVSNYFHHLDDITNYLKKNQNLFFFPYITNIHKIKKISEKNFFKKVIGLNRNLKSNIFFNTFSSVFNIKLIKQINLYNIKSIQFDLFLLFFMFSTNKFQTLSMQFKNPLILLDIKLTEDFVFKNYFVYNILISSNFFVKLNNLDYFKQALTFYFNSSNFAFSFLIGRLELVTIDLSINDCLVLSSLGNQYWFYGYKNYAQAFHEFNLSEFAQYFVPERDSLFVNQTAINDFIEVLDVESDYYDITDSFGDSILQYVDTWLQKDLNSITDKSDEHIYLIYFHSIIVLWFLCRAQWVKNDAPFDEENTSNVMPWIEELIHYDEYSEAFKTETVDYNITQNAFSLGQNYVGEEIGLFDQHWWSSKGYQIPLEESSMFDEYAYAGSITNPEQYANSEDFTKFYYFLEEFTYELDHLEGFFGDNIFRQSSWRRGNRSIGRLLKWDLYGNLFKPLPYLNKLMMNFLFINHRRRSKRKQHKRHDLRRGTEFYFKRRFFKKPEFVNTMYRYEPKKLYKRELFMKPYGYALFDKYDYDSNFNFSDYNRLGLIDNKIQTYFGMNNYFRFESWLSKKQINNRVKYRDGYIKHNNFVAGWLQLFILSLKYELNFIIPDDLIRKKVDLYQRFRQSLERARYFQHHAIIAENTAEQIYDLYYRVLDNRAYVLNRAYNRKNKDKWDFQAAEHEMLMIGLDDKSDMHFRIYWNVFTWMRNKYRFLLEERFKDVEIELDREFIDPKNSIITFFTRRYLLSFYKNITVHGTMLNDAYSNSLSIFPKYFLFLEKLNPVFRKDLLTNFPDFYKLFFDYSYIFKNDPFLNSNNLDWYYYIYNNPWFERKNIKYKRIQPFIFKNNSSINFFVEWFLFSSGLNRELESAISWTQDLYMEFFLQLGGSPNRYNLDFYSVLRFFVMSSERTLLSLSGLLDPYFFYKVKNNSNNLSFYKLLRRITKRRPISEYMVIPLDPLQEFRLQGYVQDPVIRIPKFWKESFRDFLQTIGRSFNNKDINVLNSKNATVLNNLYPKFFNEFKDEFSKKTNDINLTKSFFVDYQRIQQPEKLYSNLNFRKFNNDTWKKYRYDGFFNSLTQYIENRYQFSDRLFQRPGNYPYYKHYDESSNYASYFVTEENSHDRWYGVKEISMPEVEQATHYPVKIWDNIVRDMLNLPVGTPPLLLYNYVTGDVMPLNNYSTRKYRLMDDKRYRDYGTDDDPMETVQIVLEEGDIALNYVFPGFKYFFDKVVKIQIFLLQKFGFFDKFSFVFNYYASGNWNFRSIYMRDGVTRHPIEQINLLRRYTKNYINRPFNYFQIISYKKIYVFFSLILEKPLEEYPFLNQCIINCFHFLYFINNLPKILYIFTNTTLARYSFHYFLLVIFFLVAYFIVWTPLIYIVALGRSWLEFPHPDRDDDEAQPEDVDFYFSEDLNETNFLYHHNYVEHEIGSKLYETIFYLHTDIPNAEMCTFEHFLFLYVNEDELFGYAKNLHLIFKNEILFLNDIVIPGYKFTYNLFDIFDLMKIDLKRTNYQGVLPFYNLFFVEYLSILLGYNLTDFERKIPFYSNKNVKYHKYFDHRVDRLNYYNQSSISSTEDVHDLFDFQDLVYNFKKIDKYQDGSKKSVLPSIDKQNRMDAVIKQITEVDSVLQILWSTNSYIFNTLNILNFSFSISFNNDLSETLLFYEKKNILNLISTNFLSIFSNINSFLFLNKNGLVEMQYMSSEKKFPFYVRFNRYYDNNDKINLTLFDNDDLIYLYSSKWTYESDFAEKLQFINFNDLNFVIPFNETGVASFEILFGYLFNLKLFFTESIIFDEIRNYENLLLDFSNYEVNHFYTKSFIDHFDRNLLFNLKDIKHIYLEDWFLFFEDFKQWSIDLEFNRILPLKPLRRVMDINKLNIKHNYPTFEYKEFITESNLRYQRWSRRKKRFMKFNPFNIKFKSRKNVKYYSYKKKVKVFWNNFIYFEDPKYDIARDIFFRYSENVFQKSSHLNESLRPFDHSDYSLPFDENEARFLELFNTPNEYFRFDWLFQNIYHENIFVYSSIFKSVFLPQKKLYYSKKIISDSLFNELVLNQYINLDVNSDIFLILTPEGRSVNNHLNRQSGLQIYSYINFHLNIKLTKNLNNFYYSSFVYENLNNFDKKYKQKIVKYFKYFLQIIIFFLVCLCFIA